MLDDGCLPLRRSNAFYMICLFCSALAEVTDNTIQDNIVNPNATIGIVIGGSSPAKMVVSGNDCSGNKPTAVCRDPRT